MRSHLEQAKELVVVELESVVAVVAVGLELVPVEEVVAMVGLVAKVVVPAGMAEVQVEAEEVVVAVAEEVAMVVVEAAAAGLE